MFLDARRASILFVSTSDVWIWITRAVQRWFRSTVYEVTPIGQINGGNTNILL